MEIRFPKHVVPVHGLKSSFREGDVTRMREPDKRVLGVVYTLVARRSKFALMTGGSRGGLHKVVLIEYS